MTWIAPLALLCALALARPAVALEARVDVAQAARVDAALVLAVDISLSMDADEQRAQRRGYVEALSHPAVLDAIARGEHARVALSYIEWAGPWEQRIVAPWTVIRNEADAARFAALLDAAPISRGRGTSISAALRFATRYLEQAPPAARRVIDISGDGPNNMGGAVLAARAEVLAQGVEINGLPVMIKEVDRIFSIPELDIYYEECVIGGPAAFVLPVLDRARFATAIRQKLVLEIAGLRPPASLLRRVSQRIDCTVGERLYEAWRLRLGFD